jgi:prepilin-type processing-associated H-X9-DG protein
LLVVIAIIAVLIGLLLPAIQKAREAASRAQCQNNLKQMALALHSFHDVNERFPLGVGDPIGLSGNGDSTWQWMILPFIEQGNLYNLPPKHFYISSQGLIIDESVTPFKRTFMGTLPIFYCPSEPRSYAFIWSNRGTDYVAIVGLDYSDGLGIITYNSTFTNLVRVTDVTDGTSNTIMLGEHPPSASWSTRTLRDGTILGSFRQGNAFGDDYFDTLSGSANSDNHPGAITTNQQGQACPVAPHYFGGGLFDINDDCSSSQLWSNHIGGSNFAMGDGSVRFISYSAGIAMTGQFYNNWNPPSYNTVLPLTVLCTLATRAGGEVAEVP